MPLSLIMQYQRKIKYAYPKAIFEIPTSVKGTNDAFEYHANIYDAISED